MVLDVLLVKCSSATHFHNSSLKQYFTIFNSNKKKEETTRLNLTRNIRKITCIHTECGELQDGILRIALTCPLY